MINNLIGLEVRRKAIEDKLATKEYKHNVSLMSDLKAIDNYIRVYRKTIEKRGEMLEMNELTENIKNWAEDKGLDKSDPSKQFLKVAEEFGEIAEGLAKNNMDLVADAIGDTYVTLVILAEQLGMGIESATMLAWNEIKDRKGEMKNGVFVKKEDL